jgi:hypothetical protein
MNDEPRGNEPLLPGLSVPEPPNELRRRVLARAGRVLETRPRPDRWTRVWESGVARLAWAASVLALATCHLLIPGRDAATTASAREQLADQEELADIVDLPRLSLEAPSIAGANRALEEAETDSGKENAS